MSRLQGPELDALDAALGHWRAKAAKMLPDTPLAYHTLITRHAAVVAAARLGLPDLCELYSTTQKET